MKSTDSQRPATVPGSRVSQRVVAPLVAGAALLVAAFHLSVEAPRTGRELNLLRSALDQGDRFLLDQFHEVSRKTPPRADIVVLGIDDASQKLDSLWPEEIDASPALKAMHTPYPWPRSVCAHLLDRVFGAGAKMVFLDLAFKAPSADPEDDRLLREAIARHKGRVILGAKFEDERVGKDERVGNAAQTRLTFPSESITGQPTPAPGSYGLLSFWPDDDDIVRRVNYRIRPSQVDGGVPDPEEKLLPAVSYVAAEKIDPRHVAGIHDQERIRFSDSRAYPPLSLHQIFVEDLWKNNFANGAAFKDKIVFVGATATDLQDFQQTTIGRLAGVQLHAHALAALLARSFVQDAPPWWRWAGIAAGALLAWVLVTFLRQPLLCMAALVLLTVGAAYGSFLLFDRFSLEASPLPAALALNLCGIAGLTGNFLLQRRESRKLHRFLARYTSPEFVEEMMSDREGLYTMLGGVERTVTVFFSDVRGFTSMSENMTPTQVVTQLNEYLSHMVERVFKHRGLVDKFIGDAVMALWGSTRFKPSAEGCKQDAINAVTASLAMRAALDELNKGWRERGIAELKIGMGVHQGDVVVGNIGSEAPYEKMDLTVIGDAVNLASRLEGVTKEYGVDLIISDAVQRHVQEAFYCRSADLVAVKGKARPVEVFAVIGPATGHAPAGLETFEVGIRLYREGRFEEALAAFKLAGEEGLDDKLTQVYQDRCSQLIFHPPERWDGVFVMTKK